MKRTGKVLVDTLKKNIVAILLYVLISAINGTVFALYGIMQEPFIYAELLITAVLIVLLGADFLRELRAAKRREHIKEEILAGNGILCDEHTLRDEEYAAMITALCGRIETLQTDFSLKKQADDDYYTAWVHQIKTPIATMKLLLSQDTEEHKALSAELFRIEQYVGMVLSYIRLDSASNDLLIREYALDELIRETLHKFAPQFIQRKLRLNYTPTDRTAVTDKKWLTFILEQLISNAIKYTPEGEITITVDENTIRIADTGIGIAPEDLPRIFEKGYTGVNGRLSGKSSGLGLFLSKKAADLISAQITAESAVGKGAAFTVILPPA